jgi:Cu/Ag efflux protein CusF
VRNIVLALVVALATVGVANAQTKAPKPPAKSATSSTKAPTAKPTVTKGEVVSTDATAKTITLKDSTGSNMTLTATGSAVASLAKVKAGDHVSVTHTDTNATKIVKASSTTTTKKAKK